MGKARVSEVRGAWLKGEEEGDEEEREGGKVINILQVFSNTARLNTQWKMPLDGLYFGLESEANSM